MEWPPILDSLPSTYSNHWDIILLGSRGPEWPDLAKFRLFGKLLRVAGNFLTDSWVFCQIANQSWQMFCAFGQFSKWPNIEKMF